MPESPPLQEAHAPRAFLRRRGRSAVLAREDFSRTPEIVGTGGCRESRRGGGIDAFRDQIVTDAMGAVLARELAHAFLGVACVRELAARGQRIEQLRERLSVCRMPGEFAREFVPRMLPSREQPQRARAKPCRRIR